MVPSACKDFAQEVGLEVVVINMPFTVRCAIRAYRLSVSIEKAGFPFLKNKPKIVMDARIRWLVLLAYMANAKAKTKKGKSEYAGQVQDKIPGRTVFCAVLGFEQLNLAVTAF